MTELEISKMTVSDEAMEELFSEVSGKLRSSVRQSAEVVVQLAHRRASSDPSDADAIHLLAIQRLRRRDPHKCLAILDSAAGVLDQNSMGHRIAAYAHLALAQVDTACQHFEQAVRLDPCHSDCWKILGDICGASGRQDWAINYYQRAIIFDNSRHDAAVALARLYAQNKNLKQAIHMLRVAILRDQRSAKLNFALADLLRQRAAVFGRRRKRRAQLRFLEEACRCYRVANCSAPSAATFVAQGRLEQSLERFDAARASFQNAVRIDPNCSAAITHLANTNVEFGKIDVALQQFQSAIEIDPQRAATHFRFSRAKQFKKGSATTAYIKQLSQLVADDSRPAAEQVHLNFALAKVLDDVGHFDQAWQHYDRANRMKRGHSDFQPRRVTRRPFVARRKDPLGEIVADSIRFFRKDFLEANRNVGSQSDTPIFIVGMPRSGTTLTEQILCSHPSVAGAGELKLIEQIRRELATDGGKSDPSYPHSLLSVDRIRIRDLANQYLMHLDSCRTNESRVTDKMPTNFMHLGLIALLFPRAKVIHCRRNPMDVLVSCYCQNLNAPFCDLSQLVTYHRQYRRLMAHWNEVLPFHIHTVDYESLVRDPEANVRPMFQHCGLEWDPRCLQFHQNERSVHTPSKWQVRQPMYASSIEKWRRFEPHLQQIAEQMATDLADA